MFLAVLGWYAGFYLVAVCGGYSLVVVPGRWLLLLSVGSRVPELQWLQHMGSVVAAPRSRAQTE